MRCDRHRHGGGVAMFISDNLESQVLLCGANNLELLVVSVYNSNNARQKVHIGLWYRPPDNSVALDNLHSILEDLDISAFSSFVLIGDFNVDFYNHQHPLFCKLLCILNSFVLTQVVPTPTHTNSSGKATLIDLALLSSPSQLVECSVIPPLCNSDHDGINLILKWSRSNPSSGKVSKRSIWRYAHADFEKANRLLKAKDWTFLYNKPDIDQAWELWQQTFLEVMEECIPKTTIYKESSIPWMKKSIKLKIKKRNRVYKRAKQTGKVHLLQQYKKLRNDVVALLRKAKKEYLRKSSTQGCKQFWKTVKYFRKSSHPSIPVLRSDSNEASSNVEKATLLNQILSCNFNYDIEPLSVSNSYQFIADPSSPVSEDIVCTDGDVFCLLCAIDTTKASGPDGISGRMLKGTAESITPSLTHMFNMSIKAARVPTAWKISSVVPIPKTTDQTDNPSQYRPISLLSLVSKLLEKHIYKLLWKHLVEKGLISENQWGFTPGKSTVTALLSTFNSVYQFLEQGCDVALLFLDLRKAFDSVPHVPLLQHLKNIGLDHHILQWVMSYLLNRKQYVVVEGASSDITSVVSGVPQGSVLGPLLFLTYLNSVNSLVLTEGTQITMYADDILLVKPIRGTEDYTYLQKDITSITDCIQHLHLSMNVAKCKYIIATKKRQPDVPPAGLQLGGVIIEQVKQYRYLGVLVNEHISWSEHIKQLCSKVRKLIGMLYRQFYTWADTSTLITIYLTCIRPHLEYAAQLWDPYNKKDIELLESVQKFACKVCLKCWDMDYQNMLHCLDIPPLSVRRRYLKLITMFNIVNGQSFFPPGIFEPQSPSYNSRHRSSQNFCRPRSRTNYLQSSYVPSVIFAWNNLPVELKSLSSVSTFKDHLLYHMAHDEY